MTYVTEQTSAELRAHMKRLQAIPGWHNPLDDRLFKEIEALDAEIAALRASLPPTAITAEEAGREGEAKDAAITERQISAGARELSNRQADGCNIDREDIWKTYGNEYIEDFRAAYLAAMNLPAAPAQSGGHGNG